MRDEKRLSLREKKIDSASKEHTIISAAHFIGLLTCAHIIWDCYDLPNTMDARFKVLF